MIIERKGEKPIVKCDGCGEVLNCYGTMCDSDDGKQELHFCDACSTPANQEFRICMECGLPMYDGMTNLERVYTHEECFKSWMDTNCPDGWRLNQHEDDERWDGGYYDEVIDGEWQDTGIFYTQWY